MCTSIQSLTLLGVARLLLSCGRGALASPRRYMDFYFPAGAPAISSTGTAYWNESLGLLWTPNLEHSRLTRSDPCPPHVRSSSRVCALAETGVPGRVCVLTARVCVLYARACRMWSAYDSLTNSFALEGMRCTG